MTMEDKIKSVIFEIGKEIKIHKLEQNNYIIEVDYEKYTKQIMEIINQNNS